MGNRPLITVITACYYSQYLYEAIDSVLAQTYPSIQYIVTDDGTQEFEKDQIEQYIKQNKKDNIISFHVVHHLENLGTVRNMNSALEISEGEYIFNLSADDVFANAFVLDDWVRDMQKKQSDLSVACFEKYNEDFSELQYSFPFDYQRQLLLLGNKQHIFRELAVGNFIYGCSTARSRLCLEKFGFYDEAYRLIEDYPYVLSYIRQGGKIDLFEHICIKYRQGGSSSSKRFNLVYENDSNLIFQREILPYVRMKVMYKLIFYQWKRNQRTNFWIEIEAADKAKRIKLFLSNPVQFCISFGQWIVKQKCKATKRRK